MIDKIYRRLLKSQLRNQRSIVKDAIRASANIESLIRGQVRDQVNLKVANEILSLTKRQLKAHTQQANQERHGRSGVDPRISTYSSVGSGSSSQPGPMRPPSPPPSPPLPRTPIFPPQPLVSTRDADRKRSTIAVNTNPSRAMGSDEPGRSGTTRVDPSVRGTQPTADINIDMGYRTARTLGQRQKRGSRVRDAGRNIVWREGHDGDDEGT